MLIDLTPVHAYVCAAVYVLTMQLLLLLFQFLSVSSREHPMDLITFNSMRQLPGNFFRGSPGPAYGESQKPQPHWDFLIFLPLALVPGTSNYIRLFCMLF